MMRTGARNAATIVVAALSSLAARTACAQKTITLEEIFAATPPYGVAPQPLAISADGQRVLALEHTQRQGAARDRKPQRRVTLRETSSAKRIELPFRVSRPGFATFAPTGHALLIAKGKRVFAFDGQESKPIVEASRPIDAIKRLDDHVLIRAGNAHWLASRASKRPIKLELPPSAKPLAASANGRRVLYSLGDRSKQKRANENELTTLGWTDGRRDLNFTLPAAPKHFALTDDGTMAAFVTSVPAKRGKRQLVPDYLSREVSVRHARNARTGDAPRQSRLHLVRFQRAADVELLPLAVGRAPGPSALDVASLEFGPRDRRLLVQTIGAKSQVRQLLLYDKGRGMAAELVHSETDDRWIGPLARTAFFDASGKGIAFTSEVDDLCRLYWLELGADTAPQPLTPKDVLVNACWRAPDGRPVVSIAHPDPARRFLAVVDVENGRLAYPDQPPGWNQEPLFAASADRMVFAHSRLFQPAEIWTTRLSEFGKARQLTQATSRDFLDYRWIRPQFVRFEAFDKTPIHAHLFMPKGERPKAGWPAVVFLHGAGYLQNVCDSMTEYPKNLLFHHRLAELGYVVLCPDFRGSRGYGRAFRTGVYKDLGGADRKDVLAARRYLFDRCGVDLGRIGLYGGSYGGFLTLMCMFKEPRAFACGAALRPVTDWTRYHPGYTHPRLGHPNDEGGARVYRRTSPIWFAAALDRPLLLLHGMRDRNVFVQDTIRLSERLVELGKNFEVMLYPSQGHAFSKPAAWIDQYRRIERLFERTLR